jgi:hypothetical protein
LCAAISFCSPARGAQPARTAAEMCSTTTEMGATAMAATGASHRELSLQIYQCTNRKGHDE